MYGTIEIRGSEKYGFELWADIGFEWIQLCSAIRTKSQALWMKLKLEQPLALDPYIGSREEKIYNEVR